LDGLAGSDVAFSEQGMDQRVPYATAARSRLDEQVINVPAQATELHAVTSGENRMPDRCGPMEGKDDAAERRVADERAKRGSRPRLIKGVVRLGVELTH
jgi:hypothetical protein